MSAIEFDAQVTNGTIEIPVAHRDALQGEVHVVVYARPSCNALSKIDELIRGLLQVPGFQPMTRDETYERR